MHAIALLQIVAAAASTGSDATFCSRYATRKDCLYSPEPRCSWETSGGNSSCVCAVDGCTPVDLCVLEGATPAACDAAFLPNGAPCMWDTNNSRCTCKESGCPTRQPACTVDEHCEDDCAFPCECAGGNCYLVDECYRFDGPQCASSQWHGKACCNGHSTGADKGCFLCERQPLCTKKQRAAAASHVLRVGPLGDTARAALKPLRVIEVDAPEDDGHPLD